MNILSLFDGMSCGQIALNRAGIKYENYYAAEIDAAAIKVAKSNYPKTIHLGDVNNWRSWDIDFSKVDLLLGGSPCQGFSMAGKRLNLEDPRSRLFFVFHEIWQHIKKQNPKVKFLLENVRMDKRSEGILSDYMGVYAVDINSRLVSAQNRPRLYWSNIRTEARGLFGHLYTSIPQPKNQGILLADILESQSDFVFFDISKFNPRRGKNYIQYDKSGNGHDSQDQRVFYLHGKHGCLDTNAGSRGQIYLGKGKARKLTRRELERLQTVPDDYTATLSKRKAGHVLGNGWTVDVICHILKFF